MEDEASTRALSDPVRDGLEYPLHQDSARAPDAMGKNPEDGMPQPIPGVSLQDSLAPRLSPSTLICMADTSEFVMRSEWGEIKHRFDPSIVERMPDGRYRIDLNLIGYRQEWDTRYMPVEPLRPQCKHYVRQLIPWPDNPEHHRCQRYCGALKNDNGELFSMNDTQLLACELRSPRDFEADRQLDEFDQRIIEKGELAAHEQAEFDIDSALEKENLGVLGGGT